MSTVRKRRLVAIVDDEKAVCRAISRLVVSAGFESEIFTSAEEFLRSCRERKPDCLILDLRLSGMSGLELQQQLTADHCRIPIVFVSAHDDPSSRRQALQSGASAFLGKPFTDEALLEAIHSAMKPRTPK
jgi:FixJ family two-component response regulator